MSNVPYANLVTGQPPAPYPVQPSGQINLGFARHFSSPPPMHQGDYPPAGYPPAGGGNVPVGPGFQPAVCPTAPDMSQMEKIPGYEGIGLKEEILVPPTLPVWQPETQDQRPLQNLPHFSEEEARDAAIQYASEHCCYRSSAARELKMQEIQMINAFHYNLQTFTEKRESAWRFVPYKGEPIDGPMNGPAPHAWSMPCVPGRNFVNAKIPMPVPHTEFVKPCHTCVGNCRVRCERCFGNGRKECTWCKGRGRVVRFDNDELCTSCNATGFDRCFSCSGTGQVKCSTCDARGQLKGFVELVVTWTNHIEEYISEASTLPKESIKQVSGQTVYEEENPRVFPILQATDQAVRSASEQLISKHNVAFTNERILRQKQILRAVPIAHIRYDFNDKTDEFFVYGYEHKVYFNNYPQKCCCIVS